VTDLLFRDVEIRPGQRTDVRVRNGLVAHTVANEAAADAANDSVEIIDGRGGALLPGLADHHLHLLATAATMSAGVRCGPPDVTTAAELATALAAAPADRAGWVRATGYDERVAGDLDAAALDALHAERPVRLQHRSGALWMLNSAALRATGLSGPAGDVPAGVERNADGVPTGRMWRVDPWLRTRLPAAEAPDLTALGSRLASFGITAVTDATPDLTADDVAVLGGAAASGALPQQVLLLGAPIDAALPPRLAAGPVKIVVPDHELPALDELAERIAVAHAAGRAVAVHVVTREALVLTLAALTAVGCRAGDRLEHLAVAPPELLEDLRRDGLRVVTQPGFLADRGDRYLADVEATDRGDLYRYGSLLAAGIPVTASSDAPYGPLDPWLALRAARDRQVPGGAVLGPDERVPVDTALRGYLSAPSDPGGPPCRIEAGAPADLVLLSVAWRELLADPDADQVRMTLIDGAIAWTGG
jgi:predicted amidohydrolase YtcJ